MLGAIFGDPKVYKDTKYIRLYFQEMCVNDAQDIFD